MNKPNVILLTIDTLRADYLGCYGYPRKLTPNLDRLAADGVRFDTAITGGSWTQAAFPVMLTSSYASMYGGCLGPLAPERPSPIEALQEHGYKTGAFVTSPLLSQTFGYDRGFSHFIDLVPDEKSPKLRQMKGGQKLLRHTLVHHIFRAMGKSSRPAKIYVSAAEVNAVAAGWLDQTRKEGSPFFGWIHYMDVHWPYHLEDELQNPREIAQAWKDIAHLYDVNWHGASISENQKRHYINLYEQAIRYTDSQIGNLLDQLEVFAAASNTVVIVAADHGEEFLERSHWGHVENNLFDEIIRVPMIIYQPAEKRGRVIERQVQTLDLMPTILDLCDCSFPEGMEGQSLVPMLNGDGAGYEDTVAISERWRNEGDISHIVSARTDNFKLIWDIQNPDCPEMYNLQDDPEEKINVYYDYPDKAQELQTVVNEHLQRATQVTANGRGNSPELDETVINRLRDLGYVE